VASHIEYQNFGSSCKIRHKGNPLGILRLQVPGEHGILNSLAAVAAGLELEIPFENIASALASFQNADRRFQVKGKKKDVLVVDDYGHHPTEIVATLSAARHACDRRIVTVFQPHRYTRTRALEEDFARAFYDADVVLILPVYAAGEEPIPGITAERLVERMKEFGHRDVSYAPDFGGIRQMLKEKLREGDLLLTLGAGDVWKVGEEFLK
jgi:UDP-N-acetylmuramate--alanine ligase